MSRPFQRLSLNWKRNQADYPSKASQLLYYRLRADTRHRSKPHRYLFVLFREPVHHGLDLKPEDVGGEEFTQRRSFKPVEFAKKHGLELVGVNWMKVAADDWE